MRVLVLGKDPTLFYAAGQEHIGDALRRHILYSQRLRERFPGSEIRIITYTLRLSGAQFDAPAPGLQLYGTSSIHRVAFLYDLLRKLPAVLANKWRPDVVTVQTPWEEGVVGYYIAKRFGACFVPQLHFDLFSNEWAAESWLNPWRRRVARRLLQHASRVRVVSDRLREKVATECGIAYDRVRVAPVGVNFASVHGRKEAFKRCLSSRLANRKVVLFVGRLCAQKNLKLWVEVAHEVAKDVPMVSYVIVGDGPQRTLMHDLVIAAGLEDRFLFLGYRKHEQLPPIYAAADVLLLTSHYEGFGRVVLEAMLSALPVVSTACTGPEDLIENGKTGYLLPRGEILGLARAVSSLLVCDDKAAALGMAGRQRAQRDFNLRALADRLIDIWVGE